MVDDKGAGISEAAIIYSGNLSRDNLFLPQRFIGMALFNHSEQRI
jgi:hypothetical protein